MPDMITNIAVSIAALVTFGPTTPPPDAINSPDVTVLTEEVLFSESFPATGCDYVRAMEWQLTADGYSNPREMAEDMALGLFVRIVAEEQPNSGGYVVLTPAAMLRVVDEIAAC